MVRDMNFVVKYTKLYMIIYFAHGGSEKSFPLPAPELGSLELAGSLGNCDL